MSSRTFFVTGCAFANAGFGSRLKRTTFARNPSGSFDTVSVSSFFATSQRTRVSLFEIGSRMLPEKSMTNAARSVPSSTPWYDVVLFGSFTSSDGATRIVLYGLKLGAAGVFPVEAGIRSNVYRNLGGECRQSNLGGSGP